MQAGLFWRNHFWLTAFLNPRTSRCYREFHPCFTMVALCIPASPGILLISTFLLASLARIERFSSEESLRKNVPGTFTPTEARVKPLLTDGGAPRLRTSYPKGFNPMPNLREHEIQIEVITHELAKVGFDEKASISQLDVFRYFHKYNTISGPWDSASRLPSSLVKQIGP